jgi:membrane-bound lytic murein transglycosylase B
MCRENHINPSAQLGSYAGAMGQGQFMPSSYRRFAVKFQGNGAPDLTHNADDAIFSVANYLNRHGWYQHQKIAQIAKTKLSFCENLDFNAKKAGYAYREIQKCGFSPVDTAWSHPDKVGVLQLQTSKGNEYWLAYPNFYVILTYNSSPLYGLAVYLLGQSIQSNVG